MIDSLSENTGSIMLALKCPKLDILFELSENVRLFFFFEKLNLVGFLTTM